MMMNNRYSRFSNPSEPDTAAPPAELGLGCWSFGDSYWRHPDIKKGPIPSPWIRKYKKIIETAIKSGITHFDTAQGYGNGISEQLTGQQLKPVRPKIIIATKTYYRPPETIRKGVEISLKRLQTDYIDIFYLHWPKPGRDLRPHMEALESERREGRIRHIGVSNFHPVQIRPLLEAGQVDYCQFGYSLLWRAPEKSLVPFCLRNGIKMVSYSSLAQGVLGHDPTWLRHLPRSDPRKKLLIAGPEVLPRIEEAIAGLNKEASALGVSPAQLALGWNLSRAWFKYVLFGVRTLSQLDECVRSAHLVLPAETLRRIESITSPLAELFSEDDNIFGHRP